MSFGWNEFGGGRPSARDQGEASTIYDEFPSGLAISFSSYGAPGGLPRVISMAAGSSHAAIVSDNGCVYVSGCGALGRLGCLSRYLRDRTVSHLINRPRF